MSRVACVVLAHDFPVVREQVAIALARLRPNLPLHLISPSEIAATLSSLDGAAAPVLLCSTLECIAQPHLYGWVVDQVSHLVFGDGDIQRTLVYPSFDELLAVILELVDVASPPCSPALDRISDAVIDLV